MPQDNSAPQDGSQSVDNLPPGKNGAPRAVIRIRAATESGWFEMRPELMQALQAEYPTVDVRAQVARMILWAEGHEAARWKRPMLGIKKWLDKEAKREAKRSSARAPRGTRAARATQGIEPWWKAHRGWVEIGAERGIEMEPGESFTHFRARVCVALGEGPWIDQRDWTLMRAIEQLRGEAQATSAEQARQHLERLRQMGLYRSGTH